MKQRDYWDTSTAISSADLINLTRYRCQLLTDSVQCRHDIIKLGIHHLVKLNKYKHIFDKCHSKGWGYKLIVVFSKDAWNWSKVTKIFLIKKAVLSTFLSQFPQKILRNNCCFITIYKHTISIYGRTVTSPSAVGGWGKMAFTSCLL